jgi:hypothetical protein
LGQPGPWRVRHRHRYQLDLFSETQFDETKYLKRAKVELEEVAALASVSCPVVVREQVSSSARNITRSASSRSAGLVFRADGKAHGGELGVVTHVDTGKIPPDDGLLEGVLVLQDVGLLRSEGHLDGDTTTVGVGAPVLRVVLATVESVHFTGDVRDGPEVDGLLHVVDNLDTVASDVGVLTGHQLAVLRVGMVAHVVAVVDSREGGCNSAEGREKSECFGEHFE